MRHADLAMCYKIVHKLVNVPFDQFLNYVNTTASIHVVTH